MLLDSNIIIYLTRPEHAALRDLVAQQAPAVSVISIVEVLGYHRLTELHRQLFEQFFAATRQLPVSAAVIAQAVTLRQCRRMSLGDALIAATAMTNGLELLTHNASDFAGIEGLRVSDPLTQ